MAEVATHAGVSTATVSRALSQTRPMSPELRAKVLESAAELGYHVNLVGRTLRKRRSSTAGLIVPDLDNPFFASLAQHLSRTFERSGVDLLTFSADSDLETERRGVESFLGRQVDALVIIACHERESGANIETASRSVVTIELDRRVPSAAAHFVGCNNRYGMQLIHEHVSAHVDEARQPVVFVGGSNASSSGRERLAGFRRWFGDRPALEGSFDVSWGQQAADRLLADGMTSGTIVAAADVVALGLMSRLLTSGYSVPDDFRVIGFDGVGVADLAHPTLTTVRQPVEQISEAILDLVVRGTSEEGLPRVRRTTIRPEMVYGESSPGVSSSPS
jgi:LacI family transcriptional regulator